MLNNNLLSLIKLRNIQKPRAWLIKQGINSQTADRLLKNEQRHIRFDDMERICLGLNCSPTDVFIWQPDNEADNIPNHPLQAIRSDKILPDVMAQLNNSTLDELKQVSDFIEKMREGKS